MPYPILSRVSSFLYTWRCHEKTGCRAQLLYLSRSRPVGQRRQWQPTPVLLPWKSHGWRSLVGCSPGGRRESDTTERLHFHFSLSCIGEGNGNPLQYSCLENPRDGGAWWAAIYGVAQSWTRLKWLSSSSSSRPVGCPGSLNISPTHVLLISDTPLADSWVILTSGLILSVQAQLCLTLGDSMDGSPPAPLSMRFSRQEYWRGLPFLLQGIFPTQGSNPSFLCSLALAGEFFYHWALWESWQNTKGGLICI